MRRALAAAALLAACGGTKSTSQHEVSGTIALDGKPLGVTRCRAGRGFSTYVELVTARGKLRFEDQHLYWTTDTGDFVRGERLACAKLDRSWGGGSRTDGTSYFRGHLIFACQGPIGAFTGDVTVDCGNITPTERAELDKNRKELLAEQAAARSPDRCEEVEQHEAVLFAPARAEAVAQAKAAGLTVSPDGIVNQASGSGSGSGGPTVRAYPKPVTFTSCREDGWPADVQACAIGAPDVEAWEACLPAAIRDAMTRRQND